VQPVSGVDVAVVLDDPQDAATVLRLAAVAGVAGHPASPGDAPSWWRSAGSVVIDDGCARALVGARMPRRTRLLVVATTAEVSDATWRAALALGAEQVVALGDEAKIAEWLASLAEPASAGRLLCCMSARGGAGASTIAAALALSAAADRDVLLLDGDLHGGGIDYLLGVEAVPGVRWPEVFDASGLLPATALADALPAAGRLRVLAARPGGPGQLSQAGLDAVVGAGLRGHRLVVADAGRGGPVARALTSYADATLLVVPCEVRAAVAAAALAREVRSRCSDVRLVVRQGPGDLRPEDVATAVGAPVAAVWPWDRRLDAVVEAGNFCSGWQRSRVAAIAARLLKELLG
jgi:secretion/DNA translocation related CpaE-like protein